MAPEEGLEPPTYWLTASYSTIELLRNGSQCRTRTYSVDVNSVVPLPIGPIGNTCVQRSEESNPIRPGRKYTTLYFPIRNRTLSTHRHAYERWCPPRTSPISPLFENYYCVSVDPSAIFLIKLWFELLNGSPGRIRTYSNLINSQASLPIGPQGNV